MNFVKVAQEIRGYLGLRKHAQEKLIHFSHGDEGVTKSLSELHDTEPDKAKAVLADLIAKGYRGANYMALRKQVEDHLRAGVDRLGIKANTKYPVYAVYGHANGAFPGEKQLEFDPATLRDKLTFTIGDSFPAIMGQMNREKNEREPYGKYYQKVFNYAQLQKMVKRFGLDKLLQEAPQGKQKTPYIEAQIWDRPEALEKLLSGAKP